MNNEMNNNANNTNNGVNLGGINFVQGGAPVGGTPLNTPNDMNQMPQGMGQGVSPTPIQEVPNMNFSMPGTVPPQEQVPVNFVSSGMPDASLSNQVAQGGIQVPNQMPGYGMPQMQGGVPQQEQNPTMQSFNQPMMPGNMPQQMQDNMPLQGQTPVMLMQQPMQQPMMPGNMPPQMPMQQGTNGGNTNNAPSSEKKKLPIVMIIITILVVVGVVVFLILYLTGKITFGGKNNDTNVNNTNVVDNSQNEVILADWMNYLLDQNITELKLSRYVDTDNSIAVTITVDQLRDIFTKMNDYNLVKYYASNRGDYTDDKLDITYVKDDVSYNFWMFGGCIDFDNDESLIELFGNSEHNVEDDGQTSRDSEDYNYILRNFANDFYNQYFVSTDLENTQVTEE